MISVGTMAPDFTLLDQSGKPFRLAEHRGHAVLLLFYPLDWTPT
jgi:peroxiredoxin